MVEREVELVINRRLKEIDAKLTSILEALARIEARLDWIDRKLDLAVLAKVAGALETADWAMRSGRRSDLVSVRASLTEARAYYRLLLRAMDGAKGHSRAQSFCAYLGHLALAGLGLVHCDLELDGLQAGQATLASVAAEVHAVRHGFQAPFQGGGLQAAALRVMLSPSRRDEVEVTLRESRELCERLVGYQSELEFCRTHSLPAGEWSRLGSDESQLGLLALVPRVPR
jgi:hypothetical protein